MKKTKIVSTLGPASNTTDIIVKLIEAGANVFRFNFSHGDHEEHLARMNMVHEAEKITGKTVGIMLDTKGAEIRKFGRLLRIPLMARLNSIRAIRFVSPWMQA